MAQNQSIDLSALDEPGTASHEDVNWSEDDSVDLSFDDASQPAEDGAKAGNGGDDAHLDLNLGEEEEALALDSLAGDTEIGGREAEPPFPDGHDIAIDPDDVGQISLEEHTLENAHTAEGKPAPQPAPPTRKAAGHNLWQRLHQKWNGQLEHVKRTLAAKKRLLLWLFLGILALAGIGSGGYWAKEALTFSRLEVEQTFAVTSKKAGKASKKDQDSIQSGGMLSRAKRLLSPGGWTSAIPNWGKGKKWQPPSTTQANVSLAPFTTPFIKHFWGPARQLFSVQGLKKLGKGKKWQPPSTTQANVSLDQLSTRIQGFKALGLEALRKGQRTDSTKGWQPPQSKALDLTKKPSLTGYRWWNTLTAWLGVHTQTATELVRQKLDALGKKGKESLDSIGQEALEKISEKALGTYEDITKPGLGKSTENPLNRLENTVNPQALLSQGRGLIGRIQSSVADMPVLKNLPLERWSTRWLGKDTKPSVTTSVAVIAPRALPPPPVLVPKKPAPPPPVRYKTLKPQQPQAWVVRSAAQRSSWQPDTWHAIAQADRLRYQDAVFFAGNASWRLPLLPNTRGLSIPEKAGKPRFYYPSQGYVVQVSTFPQNQIRSATNLTNRLIQQGRFAHLLRTRNNNQVSLEVRVGPFNIREEAIRQTYPIALQHAVAKNAWVERAGKISQRQLLHGVIRSYPWVINVLRSENFKTASNAAKQINAKGKLVYIAQHRSVYGKFFYSVRVGYFASPQATQRHINRLAPQWPTVQAVEITQLEENLPGQPTSTLK